MLAIAIGRHWFQAQLTFGESAWNTSIGRAMSLGPGLGAGSRGWRLFSA